MVCKGTYPLLITIHCRYYVSSSKKSKNDILCLRTIRNGNVNVNVMVPMMLFHLI